MAASSAAIAADEDRNRTHDDETKWDRHGQHDLNIQWATALALENYMHGKSRAVVERNAMGTNSAV